MTPIWMANAHAHFDMTEDELAEAGRPRAMVRPDVEPFDPVPHYPGNPALMLIACCFTIPLAVYGAIHAGRAVMAWLLGVG